MLGLCLALGLASTGVLAEKADRGKRLVIESDTFVIDDLKRVTVLTGNVVLTKGTLVLKADRVEVREGTDGYRSAVALGSSRQASFRQKRDAPNEFIEGQADRLEYDERREALRFLDNAQVRLLRGAAVTDEIAGNLITYDGISEVFNVSGGSGRAGTAAGATGGRVRAVLAPREGSEAAEAARAAAQESAASAPAPSSSPVRGGERR
jgi:lipopolysaccharide export system protein LptA